MPKRKRTSNKTRKRRGKDLDEIHEDLRPEKVAKLMNQEIDLDLPGTVLACFRKSSDLLQRISIFIYLFT